MSAWPLIESIRRTAAIPRGRGVCLLQSSENPCSQRTHPFLSSRRTPASSCGRATIDCFACMVLTATLIRSTTHVETRAMNAMPQCTRSACAATRSRVACAGLPSAAPISTRGGPRISTLCCASTLGYGTSTGRGSAHLRATTRRWWTPTRGLRISLTASRLYSFSTRLTRSALRLRTRLDKVRAAVKLNAEQGACMSACCVTMASPRMGLTLARPRW